MAHDVFISYASADARTADELCAALEASGISCWMAPRDIRPGSEYAEQLVGAIRAARALVLVLSRAASGSEHVRRELDCAVSARIAVLPVRIEELEPRGALLYYLAGRQWCDAFPAPLERHLKQVHAAVADLLATREAAPPAVRVARRRRARALLAAAAILAAAAVAGVAIWAFAPSKTSGTSESSRATMTAAQIADKYGSSVVRITTPLMPPSATGKKEPSRIVGSGFVASKDGWIVTSLAVVQGRGLSAPVMVGVEYMLPTGEYGRATGWVVGHWEGSGVAVIKVDPRKVPLKPLPLGDSDSIALEERVVALGVEPNMVLQQATGTVAQTRTMTDGSSGNDHVEALVDDLQYPTGAWSQPLAGVGGPVFDRMGHVIALVGPAGKGDEVVWGYSGDITHQAVGIYWALAAITFAGQSGIPKHGQVYLGVECDWLPREDARKLGERPGVIVAAVSLGSPAGRAGIVGGDSPATVATANGPRVYMVGGDVIVSVDGVRLTRVADLTSIVSRHKAGDVIRIRLWRRNRLMSLMVKLAAIP